MYYDTFTRFSWAFNASAGLRGQAEEARARVEAQPGAQAAEGAREGGARARLLEGLRAPKPRNPRHFEIIEGRRHLCLGVVLSRALPFRRLSLPLLVFHWFSALGTSTVTVRT